MIATMLSRSAPGAGSNYGGMCERVASMAIIGYPCGRCDGMGFRELEPEELARWRVRILSAKRPGDRDELRAMLSLESTCRICDGTGFITGRIATVKIDSMWTTVWCGKCRGSGETWPPSDRTAEIEDVCQRCGGAMYVVPITVRSVGSTRSGRLPRHAVDLSSDGLEIDTGQREELSEWVDETSLLEFGRASAALEELRRTDEATAAAVEAYCGPEGDRWGKHAWGRLFALWPLTTSGLRLLELGLSRSREDVRHLLDPLQVLASEREAEARATQPDQRRRHYIRKSDHEARELWSYAQDVMRQVVL
jgi:hypothetical protein